MGFDSSLYSFVLNETDQETRSYFPACGNSAIQTQEK